LKSLKIVSVSLCCFFLFPFSHLILSQTKSDFDKIETFRCSFPQGISTEWKGGKVVQKPTSYKKDLIFTEINRKTKIAFLIGNLGKSRLHIILGVDVIHFLELTGSGNLITLSVFRKKLLNGKYPAVYSRHVDLYGPIISQFYGECINMK